MQVKMSLGEYLWRWFIKSFKAFKKFFLKIAPPPPPMSARDIIQTFILSKSLTHFLSVFILLRIIYRV